MHWITLLFVIVGAVLLVFISIFACTSCYIVRVRDDMTLEGFRNDPEIKERSFKSLISRGHLKRACDYTVDLIGGSPLWMTCVDPQSHRSWESFRKNIHELEPFASVYIPMPILNKVWERFIDHSKPLIIVSNEGDETPLADFLSFLKRQNLIVLYTCNVNLDFTPHPNIRLLPIGYRCVTTEYVRLGKKTALAFRILNSPFHKLWSKYSGRPLIDRPLGKKKNWEKPCRVLCALGKSGSADTSPSLRSRCINYLQEQPWATVFDKMHKKKYIEHHEDFAFEISPWGNGLSCYRTTECVLMQCIPILIDAPDNVVHRDWPCLIVKDPIDITYDKLETTHRKYGYWWTGNWQEKIYVEKFFPVNRAQ